MKGIRIRPEQTGLKSSLFDLEAEIMEVVWDFPEPHFSVQDVCDALQQHREIAYTTTMTTVSRLFDKGLLSRQKIGRKYVYQATQTREEFIISLTKQVVSSLPEMGQQTAMALLIDLVSDAADEDLEHLEQLIQAKRHNRNG